MASTEKHAIRATTLVEDDQDVTLLEDQKYRRYTVPFGIAVGVFRVVVQGMK